MSLRFKRNIQLILSLLLFSAVLTLSMGRQSIHAYSLSNEAVVAAMSGGRSDAGVSAATVASLAERVVAQTWSVQ